MAGDPEVGRWLSAMEDARRDTVREVEGLPDEAVDWRPEGAENPIGTLLYHVALVEADWLLTDILGSDGAGLWPHDWLPFEDRDAEHRLTAVEGVPSIDLVGSRLGRIQEGRPVRVDSFGGDPVAAARAFVQAGARWIHVVDTDLAFTGDAAGLGVIREISALPVRVQASG